MMLKDHQFLRVRIDPAQTKLGYATIIFTLSEYVKIRDKLYTIEYTYNDHWSESMTLKYEYLLFDTLMIMQHSLAHEMWKDNNGGTQYKDGTTR